MALLQNEDTHCLDKISVWLRWNAIVKRKRNTKRDSDLRVIWQFYHCVLNHQNATRIKLSSRIYIHFCIQSRRYLKLNSSSYKLLKNIYNKYQPPFNNVIPSIHDHYSLSKCMLNVKNIVIGMLMTNSAFLIFFSYYTLKRNTLS